MRSMLQNASAEIRRKAFETEATENRTAGYIWLVASVLSAVALIGVGSYFYQQASVAESRELGNIVELTAIRLIILSTLSLAVIFRSRNYASSRHNYVINKHRSNALATFEAFAEGTSDPEVKNAILLQAAQSIFTPQTSGHIRNEPDPSSSTQIIKVMEDLNKASR